MTNKYFVTALFFLLFMSFPFTDSQAQCLLTGISTSSGATEITTCPGDGMADKVKFKTTTFAAGYVWVITDENNVIVDFFFGNSYDFENAGAGVCRVWGVSHAGFVQIPIGEVIQDADFKSFCWVISANFVTVNRVIPDGAEVTLDNGETMTYLCPGDGVPDILTFANNSQANNDYGYIITTEDGTIIDAATGGSYDFDNIVNGPCRVYGVGHTDNLTPMPGENIFNSELSDGCYDLSDNFVQVFKDEPDGGLVSTLSGDSFVQVCVEDGNPSVVEFAATGFANLFYAFVITDDNDNFLTVQFNDSHDFEGAPAGTCRVYGVSYVGNFIIQQGENIFSNDLTDDCSDISDNYIEILRSEPNGSSVSLDDGTTQTFTCPGDGNADVVNFSTSSGSTALYAYLITDNFGEILTVTSSNSHDFEDAPAGTCRIYGISYVGNLLAAPGLHIDADILADDCWEVSTNFIEVIRETPEGGSIETTNGESMIYVCIGDANPDIIEFEVTGESNSKSVFVVTDENLEIKNILNTNSFNFNSTEAGTCRVYYVAYTGNFGLIEGQFLDANDASDDCADISDNYVTVIKDTTEGGFVFGNGTQELIYTCPGDGKADEIQFINLDASQVKYAWLILDDFLQVLDISHDGLYDFDGRGEGLTAVFGVSYTGNLIVQVGDDPFITPLSDDCYDLSDNWVDIIHFTPEAGTVVTLAGTTNVDVCSGDGIPDVVEYEAIDAAAIPYMYVITDDGGKILSFAPLQSLDFESVAEGVCRIYGVSYTGDFIGIVGENIHDILLSDDCYDVSDNYIEITRKFVEGGEVSVFLTGQTTIYTCPGDGNPNVIDFSTSSDASTAEYIFVITDNQHVITDILTEDKFDFENSGVGVSKVWGISYTGNLLANVGDEIDQITLSDACWSLSENYIEVIRDTPNGDQIVSNLGDNIKICVGDEFPDSVAFITGSFSFAQYVFIVTDEFNEVVEVMDSHIYDFENQPEGGCRIWGLSYTGNLTVQPGDLTDFDPLSDDCFDLSNNYISIGKTEVDGGTVFSPSGDEIFVCAGDGSPDFVGFFNTSMSGNSYRYLITSESGTLLDVVGFNLYNFENSGSGTCRVYGLDFTGILNVFVGQNIFDVQLSNECYDLSEDFITVHKDLPDGGNVATDGGETSITVIVNDGNPDVVNFVANDASNSKYRWIITDENNEILDILTDPTADFEGAGEGVCRVWGLSYSGGIAAAAGDIITDVNLATGCEDLSDNFIEIIRDDPNTLTNPGDDSQIIEFNRNHVDFELTISPNPVSDILKIQFESVDFEGVSHVEIVSSNGEKIRELNTETMRGYNEISVETDGFSPGTYFVLVRNKEGFSKNLFVKI